MRCDGGSGEHLVELIDEGPVVTTVGPDETDPWSIAARDGPGQREPLILMQPTSRRRLEGAAATDQDRPLQPASGRCRSRGHRWMVRCGGCPPDGSSAPT